MEQNVIRDWIPFERKAKDPIQKPIKKPLLYLFLEKQSTIHQKKYQSLLFSK